jgi:5-methylcytosine-specific restriction endonuclease McrA
VPPRKGYKQTLEHRAKVVAAGRTAMLGKRHSAITKAMMSVAQIRRHEDPAERVRRSVESRARWQDPDYRERQRLRLLGNHNLLGAPVIGECTYCGDPATTRDHIVPRSRGGSDDPSNLTPACLGCNASKQDRTPDEWLADLRIRVRKLEASAAMVASG